MIKSPKQAAEWLGISLVTLARLRTAGTGPAFVRVSPRRVGYEQTELDAYLNAKRRTSTLKAAA